MRWKKGKEQKRKKKPATPPPPEAGMSEIIVVSQGLEYSNFGKTNHNYWIDFSLLPSLSTTIFFNGRREWDLKNQRNPYGLKNSIWTNGWRDSKIRVNIHAQFFLIVTCYTTFKCYTTLNITLPIFCLRIFILTPIVSWVRRKSKRRSKIVRLLEDRMQSNLEGRGEMTSLSL